MGEILVGITSWTEQTLIASGAFYPAEVKNPEDRLRFYADPFPLDIEFRNKSRLEERHPAEALAGERELVKYPARSTPPHEAAPQPASLSPAVCNCRSALPSRAMAADPSSGGR